LKNSFKRLPQYWVEKRISNIAYISVGKDVKEASFSKEKTKNHKFPVFSNTVDNYGLYGYYDFPEYNINGLTIVGRGAGLGTAFPRKAGFGAIGRLLVLSPKNNDFDTRYLSEYINNRFRLFHESGGIPQLPGITLGKYKVVLPPLPEQRAIANILATWDEAIEIMDRLIAAKEKALKAYGLEIFSQKQANIKWGAKKLKEILHEHGDKSTGREAVCSVSVHKGLINQIEHLGRSFSASNTDNYNNVHYGDVVYTKSPTGDFPYGIVKQSLIKQNVIVSPLYGVFSPKTLELGIIIDFYFESPVRARNYLYPIIQKGAKNTINITNKTFISGMIYLPVEIEEQVRIADQIRAFREEIYILKNISQKLKEQKHGLMQKLLTGEWRVKV
jgi:type I restriction enzyme, S subunit